MKNYAKVVNLKLETKSAHVNFNFRILFFLLGLLPVLLFGQLTAEIEVEKTDICIPQPAKLKITGCVGCTTFEWKIGNGAYQMGADQYATIITKPGVYDVSVIVTTASGQKFGIYKPAAFTIREAPVINMSYDKQSVCGSNVPFTFIDNTPNSVSRDWLLEGQMFYSGPDTMKHLFTSLQGFKRVFIVVRDSWGCAASKLYDSFFSVWSLKPTISSNPQSAGGCIPATLKFNAVPNLQGQDLDSVSWHFPNSVSYSAMGNSAQARYNQMDTFSFEVYMRTKQGCRDTARYPKSILVGDSVKLALASFTNSLCIKQKVQFQVNGSIGKINWDFTGGGGFISDPLPDTKIKGHFTDTGWVSIRAWENNHGCISEVKANRAVFIKGPKVSFLSEIPNYCATPDTVSLFNSSAEGPGTTWRWTLFDSNSNVVTTSTAKQFKYITNSLNKYSARLIASSSNGCADTLFVPEVSIGGSMKADYKIDPVPTCPNTSVFFTPIIKNKGKNITYTYKWFKYDLSGNVVSTIDIENGTFSYAANGTYDSKLVINSSRNCTVSIFKPDSVIIKSPEVTLIVKDSFPCIGQGILLDARKKSPAPGFYGIWEAYHQDSSKVRVFLPGDSLMANFTVPGPYSLSYSIQRIKDNQCRQVIWFPNTIRVSGAIVRASATPSFGCAPLNVTLRANVTADYNYLKGPGPVKFRWKRDPVKGFPLTDSTSATITSTLAAGNYSAYVVHTNNSGCMDSSYRMGLESGVKSAIDIPFVGRCKGTVIQILNRSSAWADSFRYVCDSAAVKFFPSNVHPTPTFTAHKAGVYLIKLIAKYKGCSDTSEQYVSVVQAKASFYSPDTITYCAPKIAEIFNTSPGAMQSTWYFSDFDTIRTYSNDKFLKLFVKNNPVPGYSIKMHLIDYNGCRDTVEKKFHFKVVGPVPDLKLVNFVGCEPLEVKFINNSTFYKKFYIDYGDGAVLDSVNGEVHRYRVTNKALPIQYFKPKMLVADTLGCVVLAFPDDSVQVFKGAEAKFSFTSANFLRKTEGCAGDLLVKFTDLSKFSVRNYWDFDSDKVIDITSQTNPNFLYVNPGTFYPRLIAENLNGCKDTITVDSIIAWEKPVPDFKPSADTTCARDMVFFRFTGSSKYPITKYTWDFDETWTVKDTSSQRNTKWKYTAPFNKMVSLAVVDEKGCKATKFRNVFVLDTAGPVKPDMAYVTVRNNEFADFSWNISKLGNYYRYHVFQDSAGYFYRYGITPRNDTFRTEFKGTRVNNTRYCYSLKVEDTCSQMGRMAISHCTIVLRDSAEELYHMNLRWLSYDGWGLKLSHYELFRKDQPGGSFKRIAIIDKDKLFHTDSFLCDQTYCYYIEAVHENRVYRSRSNETCGKPIYRKPEGTSNIQLVTVTNDSFPSVKWSSTYQRIPGSSFVVEKSVTGNGGTFQFTGQTKDKFFDDKGSDAHASAWFYRITFKDHCGTLGNPGSLSNSIFLRPVPGGGGPGKVKISWNQYQYWHSGVKEYRAEVKNSSGQFVPWLTFVPGETEKENIDLESFGVDTITFRVIAIKDSADNMESYSNTVSFIPSSYLWVPSGFTPDDNGLNEIFRPSVGYVFGNVSDPSQRYELLVLNRWGQQIFQTNDPKKGWDGTFGGNPCPVGLYIYQVKAVGYDGVALRKNGTIYLSR